MRKRLIALAYWIFKRYRCEVMVVQTPEIVAAVPDARALCQAFETASAPGTSGEWKRHNVYAALIKRYPQASKRSLSMAIEIALCDPTWGS